MPRPFPPSRLAALSLLALVAACADSPAEPAAPTGPDALAIDADVAAATGAGIATDLSAWIGSEVAVSPDFAVRDAAPAGDCRPADGGITCTGGREGALEVTRRVRFLDAAGAPQARYDALATARVDIGLRLSGSMSGPRLTRTVERAQLMSVSGLAGEETERTWNGTGRATVRSTYTGDAVTREHRMVETDTTTDVVIAVAPRGPAPLSGTIARTVAVRSTFSGARTGTFAAVRRVVVTFNGTTLVPLTVSTATRGGQRVELACTLDLAARTVSCQEPGDA